MMLDRLRLASLLQAFPRQTIPPGALRAALRAGIVSDPDAARYRNIA